MLMRTAAIVIALALAAACSSEGDVSAKDFGSDWPFTVERGHLMCHDAYVATFRAEGGRRYALNGAALQAGYPDAAPIRRSGRSLDAVRARALELCR